MHADTEGAPRPTDPVAQQLEQLVDLKPSCLYCDQTIYLHDMLVAWPAAEIIAHFACYAKAQHLVKQPATADGGGMSC